MKACTGKSKKKEQKRNQKHLFSTDAFEGVTICRTQNEVERFEIY